MNRNDQKHLTLESRKKIEEHINAGMNFKEIAKFLSKDPSTISKEVKKHKMQLIPSSFNGGTVKCAFLKTCENKAGNSFTFCNTKCKDFVPEMCKRLSKPPFVCNPCDHKNGCRFIKYYYRAESAQKAYRETLVDLRSCVALGSEDFYELDNLLTPLVQKGQSLAHIYSSNTDSIHVSRRTVYNYFDKGYLSVGNLDLPRKVKYKPRKKAKSPQIDKKVKEGRDYQAFLNFCNLSKIDNYVEMDTVVGNGSKVLLTLLFTNSNFMLARLLDDKTSQSVLQAFYHIRKQLEHKIDFSKLFSVILTDNGTEFSNPLAIESNENGEMTSKVFFCDPYCSCQKPHIEKNHEYIRYVLPSGTSFDSLTQCDINLMMSHINSVKRDSLNGKSPYEIFSFLYGADIAKVLEIEEIKSQDIILKRSLIKN